ncbi:COP23 domain-containing protein [Spirulina subsalsa FACHB-351]|uniref:COP23 domain-containing protein n=1 Tax=Spirulina subsalsa FACHB-351 TaxID=234711 RepID=A0ABT3L020_9CYAN|nr:COP23 domain-containing protein [Spirulina subsalsa]MCW6034850.1 COP23 domain-containing protein [Spirulina subsalsa FACHB-351]
MEYRTSYSTLSLPLVGLALLLSGGSAQATEHTPLLLSQATPEAEDVIIQTEDDPRFTCQSNNGSYTVMYTPKEQPEYAYPWASPQDLGGGWTADKRCNTISQRLEQYRPDGLLELRTGVENNYNVICVTTQTDPSCRIVLTVPPGQDPIATRDQVFQNLTLADSGQATQGVNTFINGGNMGGIIGELGNMLGIDPSSLGGILGGSGATGGGAPLSSPGGINLRPFLAPSDGGTGTHLRQSSPIRNTPRPVRNPGNPGSGRTLNPDNFR